MDVDLSTGLEALLPLVAPLISGHSDLAIGTRLARGSRVVRGPKREVISRTYNRLLHLTLRSRFSDAQCGFKAGRAEVVKALLPRVEDQAWFFDTELLVLAERSGLRIHEVPVDWVDDPDSRVDIVRTALDDLRGIARLGGELSRFALVGVASTVLYLLLFVALRGAVAPLAANAAALALSAVFNTAANRRFTFGRRGREGLATHHVQGLAVFGVCLGLTTLALAGLGALAPGASQGGRGGRPHRRQRRRDGAALLAPAPLGLRPARRRRRGARGPSCKDWRRVRRLVRGRRVDRPQRPTRHTRRA